MSQAVGFLINKLDISQKANFTLKTANALARNYPTTIFYLDTSVPTMDNICSILSAKEAYSFEGVLIASDYETSRILLNCVSPLKFLYIWDLEWTINRKKWVEWSKVYQNDRLELLCRSESHAKLVSACWKKPYSVIQDLDNEQIEKIVKQLG